MARLDLNRATLEQLDGLPGVGPVLAGRILAFRRDHGRFRDLRDLRAVQGIGPHVYAGVESLIEIRSIPRPP